MQTLEESILNKPETLATFFSLSADPLCIASKSGFFKKVNAAFMQLLGYGETEILGQSCFYFIHPEDIENTKQALNLLVSGSRITDFENRYRKKNGEYCYLSWSLIVSGDEQMVFAVARDHTVQRLAEDAIIASEKSYKSLFNGAPLPQWIHDLDDLMFINVNDAAMRHYGYSIGEFLQMSVNDVRSEESKKDTAYHIRKVRNASKPYTYTTTHLKKNNKKIIVEVTSAKVFYKGKIVVLATINDVTEKIKLQEKLIAEKVLRERKVTQATISAQEKERNYIGKELHDNVNQLLAGAKLYLEMALADEKRREEMIERSMLVINDSINEIRQLSKSFVLSTLTEISIDNAISEITEPYLLTHKFRLHTQYKGAVNEIPYNIKLTVVRILQEQFNNIAKYAAAANVWVTLKYSRKIELVIKDDGKGFDTEAKRDGIGLSNIRNRVDVFGGMVEINSKPGEGCSMLIQIPC